MGVFGGNFDKAQNGLKALVCIALRIIASPYIIIKGVAINNFPQLHPNPPPGSPPRFTPPQRNEPRDIPQG